MELKTNIVFHGVQAHDEPTMDGLFRTIKAFAKMQNFAFWADDMEQDRCAFLDGVECQGDVQIVGRESFEDMVRKWIGDLADCAAGIISEKCVGKIGHCRFDVAMEDNNYVGGLSIDAKARGVDAEYTLLILPVRE